MTNDKIPSAIASESMAGTQGNPIVPVTENQQISRDNNSSTEDYRTRVKSFEPIAGSIWNIPCGISAKVLRNKIVGLLGEEGEEEADRLADMARPSPESLKAAKDATARILARRCENSEAADSAILVGVAVEMGYGFTSVLGEIKKIEKRLLNSKPANEKK